jgi:hypothetical protein
MGHRVQNVLLLTITGDKFVIYVTIRRYGDFNTLRLRLRVYLAKYFVDYQNVEENLVNSYVTWLSEY